MSAENQSGWRLEPHVCRACYCRIVSRPVDGDDEDAPHRREWMCTNCGASAVGAKASVICSCGTKLVKSKGSAIRAPVMVDAGIRCIENDNPTPMMPSLYVASQIVPNGR